MSAVIVISDASRQLLVAHSRAGILVGCRAVEEGFEIELDDDVYDSLMAIDRDVDKAIRILCSTGFGHA